MTSDLSLDVALQPLWDLPKESRVEHARNLGTDAVMGSLRRVQITRNRWDKARGRTAKIKKLREAGA
eukprot:7918815-Pyramimonas_sp.AAC.1